MAGFLPLTMPTTLLSRAVERCVEPARTGLVDAWLHTRGAALCRALAVRALHVVVRQLQQTPTQCKRRAILHAAAAEWSVVAGALLLLFGCKSAYIDSVMTCTLPITHTGLTVSLRFGAVHNVTHHEVALLVEDAADCSSSSLLQVPCWGRWSRMSVARALSPQPPLGQSCSRFRSGGSASLLPSDAEQRAFRREARSITRDEEEASLARLLDTASPHRAPRVDATGLRVREARLARWSPSRPRAQLSNLVETIVACWCWARLSASSSEPGAAGEALDELTHLLRQVHATWHALLPDGRRVDAGLSPLLSSIATEEVRVPEALARSFLDAYLRARGLAGTATPADLTTFLPLFHEYFLGPTPFARDNGFTRLVRVYATERGADAAVVGVVLLGGREGDLEMRGIVACPFHARTRRGVGRAILDHLERTGRRVRVDPVPWAVEWRASLQRRPFIRGLQGESLRPPPAARVRSHSAVDERP